ncbi:hypothetical protein [Pseudonocardia asaccharolytica]|uniref:Membrane transport protein MMPL domain-containing protein n=1 Tax=Pseudonocardia asaccharolytica DSM 44247 = NBRC 16224 TaxID=1123024 RepID=A0A511D382_9PSEU|nr:hypothetical protein [Pseudonocardia asaccharolytica]GEL19235.1 hypothetical protein PA7_30720 [Pseudonocardia asaccharolytica DSM 44247 = NBRC 16224]
MDYQVFLVSRIGGFVSGDARTIKLLGLGMAAAVLLDAFVIPMLVVPALMHRLGVANWWIRAGSTGSCRASRSRAWRSTPTSRPRLPSRRTFPVATACASFG